MDMFPPRKVPVLCLLTLAGIVCGACSMPALAGDATISFVREIAPILNTSCVPCHHADKAKGGYRLHSFQALNQPGKSKKPPLVPGTTRSGSLFSLLTTADAEDRMPQNGDPLPAESIALIRSWIEQGARFDGTNESMSLV